jgi:putative nucleotidyltransferase with HDIG domain
MRTFWTEQTVNRSYDKAGFTNPQEYLTAKQKEFEKSTGVKWSVQHVNAGYAFHPIDEGVAVANTVSDEDVAAIRRVYDELPKDFTGYVTYLSASEKTDIGLRRLMPIVKWLEKEGKARRTVDRMGKGYAFKLVAEGKQAMKKTASQVMAQCRMIIATDFKEHPLKMLKRVRNKALEGDEIFPDEEKEIFDNAKYIVEVKPKKIGKVLRKIAKKGQIGIAVEMMDRLGLLEHVIPELASTKGVARGFPGEKEGDVFQHLVEAAKNAPSTVEGQFSALFHDIAKQPRTGEVKRNDIKFPGHAKMGAAMAREILERLKFKDDIIEQVETAVAEHGKMKDLATADDEELWDFIEEVGPDNVMEVINTSKATEVQDDDTDDAKIVERRVRKLVK